jgi:hypothetical protein
LKPDALLQLHGVSNAAILDGPQRLIRDFTALAARARLEKLGRTKQASHMIRPKRRLGASPWLHDTFPCLV